MLLAVLIMGYLTRMLWLPSIPRTLICDESVGSSDAILVDNSSPNYLVFERAATLQRAGASTRVFIPVFASPEDPDEANPVSQAIAELIARFARLNNPEIVTIRTVEPYTLNTAYAIRDVLLREQIRSLVVVAPALRSRRTLLVFEAVLTPVGIRVSCVPVLENHTPENWTTSWHGMEVVMEQFLKLQAYRLHLLGARPGRW
jgi:hypothetical protein